ncbi:Stp1/IreP family PP2C-type Ser/Thr phosphatase [Fervidibacillus halotolerans]|uniref:protein-serine/threonine phosphatase n=1 Tax=Fervidibacillus halotolerans TaxID=2980027 RepID=A0A9E8S1L8_9BACI|nr:Stp1/IreP family PP2C-type Ser/Thr phosphatase [Fervidibacillus halotolerans]WAA13652.1 Stp1/IreP family PP2C-type Ser/Thr phosphatase [Fervidibacillus halotolerans]
MEAIDRTDRGKVRNLNEDYVGVFKKDHGDLLAVVADGMGGHLAGDVASKMATERMEQLWNKEGKIETPEQAERFFKEKIKQINYEIFKLARENKDYQGMGTTLVASICTEKFVTVANIGDSRCYLINHSGMKQLTDDHSLVNELVKSGQISKEDAEHHPRKNILLRALGTEKDVEVDLKTIGFEKGNYLLLCSDGLTNMLTDREIEDVLLSERKLGEKADYLIQRANDNGGVDNISLIIVYHHKEEKEEVGELHVNRKTDQ